MLVCGLSSTRAKASTFESIALNRMRLLIQRNIVVQEPRAVEQLADDVHRQHQRAALRNTDVEFHLDED